MNCVYVILFLLCMTALQTHAQTYRYTNTETGSLSIPLGFDVPIPIDSLTPVTGFRSYDSLNLRHQQLSLSSEFFTQQQVGQTYRQLPIWAYEVGDADNLTQSGESEASALINGGIHAREWQTPEALTGYMEYLYDNADDHYMGQYLIENIKLVVIPVLNIDGFLQTQRYPTQVTSSVQSPRDGRMRRKNMRDADQDLITVFDNLQGVDLNRNNNPYWATSDASSDLADNIVYHGTAAESEPEVQALQQAATLAGSSRLRFYTDTHSFSQIYLTPYTDNGRRNNITAKLATVMRAANNYKYEFGPSAAGAGIGSTDEYFAIQYQIPSYTLELEPQNSAQQYGGFGVSHDGFILPSAEVPRMRDETRKAAIAGLYSIAQIPFVTGIDVFRVSDNQHMLTANWSSSQTTRQLNLEVYESLQANEQYQLLVRFNKPMRAIDNGQVVAFSNLSDANGVTLSWEGINNGQSVSYAIQSSQGQWLVESGFVRYKTDTYEQQFSLPADFVWSALSLLSLKVDTTDMVGQTLDANPATVVDWSNGAWIEYENAIGRKDTDTGGADKSIRLIDDGSDLFASVPVPSTPTPTNPGNGGGGAMFYLLSLLCTVGLIGNKKQVCR